MAFVHGPAASSPGSQPRVEETGEPFFFLPRPAPVHRHDHRAEPGDGVKRDHVVGAVLQVYADDIAGPDALRPQMRRPAAHQPVELGIIDGAPILDDGRMIGAPPRVIGYDVGEVHGM